MIFFTKNPNLKTISFVCRGGARFSDFFTKNPNYFFFS